MSAELYRQIRRAETRSEKGSYGTPAERADRRRRLRLDLLRQHLNSNVGFLRAAHLGGASGQQSVQAYAAFMDGFLATLAADTPPAYPPATTYPDPVEHCDVCRWAAECATRRRERRTSHPRQ